ncbi:MAG: hypothetical protein HQK49_21585 [Oligoflexia bacterium]|nr:hypothetical protein [Oligoflexia bacterium]
MIKTTINILIVFFSLSITTTNVHAGNGMILVYEAPLFKEPNIKSKVVQKIPKGKIIYIHHKHFSDVVVEENAVIAKNSYRPDQFDRTGNSLRDFYITYDNNANQSYILKDHVKLIYQDIKELEDPAPSFNLSNDPTDFRMKEPIPQHYPLYNSKNIRNFLTVGTKTQSYKPYQYDQTLELNSKEYGIPLELTYSYLQAANFDKERLYYFGGILIYSKYSNQYFFENNSIVEERYRRLGIGPYLSYDFYQIEDSHLFTVFMSPIIYLINEVDITITIPNGGETQTFNNRLLSLRTGIIYQRLKILNSVDLILGAILEITPSNTLEATANNNNQFKKDNERNFSSFIGFQLQI